MLNWDKRQPYNSNTMYTMLTPPVSTTTLKPPSAFNVVADIQGSFYFIIQILSVSTNKDQSQVGHTTVMQHSPL